MVIDPVSLSLMGAAGLGAGFGLGGKNKSPNAYATGQFDLASAGARSNLTNWLADQAGREKQDYRDQVRRGIENRVAVKEMENQRLAGPNLKATEIKNIPHFLKEGAPQFLSGADRGTLHGAALEEAMKEGKTEVDPIKVELGAKGTPTGLRNESIPRFQSSFGNFSSYLPDAGMLHAQAAQQAQNMNNSGGK
jgi:hypothetical protein